MILVLLTVEACVANIPLDLDWGDALRQVDGANHCGRILGLKVDGIALEHGSLTWSRVVRALHPGLARLIAWLALAIDR